MVKRRLCKDCRKQFRYFLKSKKKRGRTWKGSRRYQEQKLWDNNREYPNWVYFEGSGKLCLKHKSRRSCSTSKFRAKDIGACPKWVDSKKIKDIYEKASENKMHVDHIIPLNHKHVCGLHVPWNLQLLSPSENFIKSNKFPFQEMSHAVFK